MKKLALVRYGEYENNHLSIIGIGTMTKTAKLLESITDDKNTCIISADLPRATESAKVISKNLNIYPVKVFSELYAADERNIKIDLDKAIEIINSIYKKYEIIIAVISREYIETLPDYILKSLGNKETIETHLNRGEVVVLNYESKNITYLR